MENQNSPIALQHAALEDLIINIYGLNFKSFLIDASEIIEQHSNSDQLVEGLWEIASMLPMDHSDPE